MDARGQRLDLYALIVVFQHYCFDWMHTSDIEGMYMLVMAVPAALVASVNQRNVPVFLHRFPVSASLCVLYTRKYELI